MEIFQKLNEDTYWRKEDKNIVSVIREVQKEGDGGVPFDYDTLEFDDFFNPLFNQMFSKICPCIVWMKGYPSVGLWMQIKEFAGDEERDFLMIRDNVGMILASIAEMSAGECIRDRRGNGFIFGKPIPMGHLFNKFMDMLQDGTNDVMLRRIKNTAIKAAKYCRNNAKGIGSVANAVNRATDGFADED